VIPWPLTLILLTLAQPAILLLLWRLDRGRQ
jgi:hypothetical protein